MIFTQGHLGKFKVTGRKSVKFVPVLYPTYGETLDVPNSHKDCLRVCHELDLDLVVQVLSRPYLEAENV